MKFKIVSGGVGKACPNPDPFAERLLDHPDQVGCSPLITAFDRPLGQYSLIAIAFGPDIAGKDRHQVPITANGRQGDQWLSFGHAVQVVDIAKINVFFKKYGGLPEMENPRNLSVSRV